MAGKLFKFTINKNDFDVLPHDVKIIDDKHAKNSDVLANALAGYVPRHQWDHIDPEVRKQLGIEAYTEAVERLHGHTISTPDDVTSADKIQSWKKSATFCADAFVRHCAHSRKPMLMNIDDPSGKHILKMVDEDGSRLPTPSEQRIVSVIAKALKVSEAEAKQGFSVIPTHGVYPWVPDAAYAEIRSALEGSGISVERENHALHFKYPISESDYCLVQ
jgi:hypothetical protein